MIGWSSSHMTLEHSAKTSLDSRLYLRCFWPASTQSTCKLYFDFSGRLVFVLHPTDFASLLVVFAARGGALTGVVLPAACSWTHPANIFRPGIMFSELLASFDSRGPNWPLSLCSCASWKHPVEIVFGESESFSEDENKHR